MDGGGMDLSSPQISSACSPLPLAGLCGSSVSRVDTALPLQNPEFKWCRSGQAQRDPASVSNHQHVWGTRVCKRCVCVRAHVLMCPNSLVSANVCPRREHTHNLLLPCPRPLPPQSCPKSKLLFPPQDKGLLGPELGPQQRYREAQRLYPQW